MSNQRTRLITIPIYSRAVSQDIQQTLPTLYSNSKINWLSYQSVISYIMTVLIKLHVNMEYIKMSQ